MHLLLLQGKMQYHCWMISVTMGVAIDFNGHVSVVTHTISPAIRMWYGFVQQSEVDNVGKEGSREGPHLGPPS